MDGLKSINYGLFFTTKSAPPPVLMDLKLPQFEAYKRVPKDPNSWNTSLGANRCTTLFVPDNEFFPYWDSLLFQPSKDITKEPSKLWFFQMSVSTVALHEQAEDREVMINGAPQMLKLGRIEASFYDRIVKKSSTESLG